MAEKGWNLTLVFPGRLWRLKVDRRQGVRAEAGDWHESPSMVVQVSDTRGLARARGRAGGPSWDVGTFCRHSH